MKYIGEFYSIDETLYRIEIETKKSGTDKKLKLSDSPFTSSVSSEDKHIYSPIKSGGATIGILTNSYEEDFYTGEAKGVKVTFYNASESDKVEWVGYITPSIYTLGFDTDLEELSLDCIDGIAVLKNIPYSFSEPSNPIISFAEILFNCLRKSECYKAFYISDNVLFTASGSESIIDKLRLSQNNFFDAKEDINQTNDDVAWCCFDVLNHLCLFLGYTLLALGDEVFIIDYDAIKAGNNTYYRYSLDTTTIQNPTKVTKAYSKFIEGDSYSLNGTAIEMTEVYNKVTVKDEFNTFDNLFPTFGDLNFETNITAPSANLSPYFHNMTIRDHGLQFGDHIKASPEDGIFEDFCILIDTDWFGNWWLNVFKFYDTPVFNMLKYDRNSRNKVTIDSNIKYSDILSYNGAFYYRWYKTDAYQWIDEDGNHINDIYQWIQKLKASYNYNASTADKLKIWIQLFQLIKMIDKIQLQPVIAFINEGNNRFGPADEVNYNSLTDNDVTKNYPFVTLKDYSSSIFGGANHYLRIKGTFSFHDEPVTPHKLNNGKDNGNLKRKGDYKRGNQGYIWCKLKWGDRFWNGTDWKAANCWFKLYYWNESILENGRGIKNLNNYDKDFNFMSNGYSLMNLGEEGYIIPCPTDGNLNGLAELSFTTRDMWGDSRRSHWHPKGNKGDNFYCRYLSKCVFITNLEITAEVYEGFLDDADYNSDTCYTNVIENGAVDKMNEITFKVCTEDGKKPSYSCVDYLDNGNSKYVAALYNKALYSKEKGTVGTDGFNGVLRQEEHYVFKLASQYEEPRLILLANLRNDGNKLFGLYTDKTLSGKSFIPTEVDIDYKYNRCSMKLTEKA